MTDLARRTGTRQPTPQATGHPALFAHYAGVRTDRTHDEAVCPRGHLRPHWHGLIEWLARQGTDGSVRIGREIERLRTESGIAFDPARGSQVRGAADTLPIPIAPADWDLLCRGVAQRARLIEATLADLYGSQAMLTEGVLPPALIFADDSFSFHCMGWETPPDPWLFVYEMDLARAADGRWMVLADRVDAPLGDGWMLANRIAVSQAFADPFLDLGVQRLDPHYTALADQIADRVGADGQMALLTPGAGDGRYFSHAYLARYLGAALIEPQDLTVRQGGAFVKTIGGLKRVDVLLRGVHDRRLDVLFRPSSAMHGAPALSLAARRGRLAMMNPLGTACLAYRAMAPFAHALCQRLLGEELILSDGPCLWLGDARAVEQVLDEPQLWRAEGLKRGPLGADGVRLTDPDRDGLVRRLRREGERLAAVATPPLSTTPVWSSGALAPRQVMMRLFANRDGQGRWTVAPGGVAAVVDPGCPPPPLSFGKDLWVMPDGAADTGETETPTGLMETRMHRRVATAHHRRTGADLLSRFADDLFWVGRMTERADLTLRVLHLAITRALRGQRGAGDSAILSKLVATIVPPKTLFDGPANLSTAVARLAADPEVPQSISSVLAGLRAIAQRAQPYISEEGWRALEQLTTPSPWATAPSGGNLAAPLRNIEAALNALSAFSGATHENLTRNAAWRFLEAGRRIERGMAIAAMADSLAGHTSRAEEVDLRAWITLCDSRTAYRTRYLITAAAVPAIDLLILDETNPRALAYQLAQLETAIAAMPERGHRRPLELRLAMKLLMDVRLAEPEVLAEPDEDGARSALLALTATIRDGLGRIADQLARSYFAHAEAPNPVQAAQRSRP